MEELGFKPGQGLDPAEVPALTTTHAAFLQQGRSRVPSYTVLSAFLAPSVPAGSLLPGLCCLFEYSLSRLLYPRPFLILPGFRSAWKLQICLGSIFPLRLREVCASVTDR